MNQEKIFIKNMVCDRCIRVVREELERNGYKVNHIQLGEADISSDGTIDRSKINNLLTQSGFELIEDKNVKIIERIKTLVIDLVHWSPDKKKANLSDYLSSEIGKDYHSLSTLFSQKEGITIEKFYILQKIEKVKELIIYGEYNLSEIAFKLDYSSVAHLSNQFKQVTGFTPTEFKKLNFSDRKPLDKIGGESKE